MKASLGCLFAVMAIPQAAFNFVRRPRPIAFNDDSSDRPNLALFKALAEPRGTCLVSFQELTSSGLNVDQPFLASGLR